MAPGSAPQAPPDNVLLLPLDRWRQIFDPQAAARPDTVHMQLHIRIAHALPASPGAAYTVVQQLSHNVEARIAGSGIVGDNLAARLDGARADGLYAQVLFLFLGLPGAILAVLLTLAVAASGATRRRQEQALLRTRGASARGIVRLESAEALIVGGGGVLLGIVLAVVAALLIVPADTLWSPLGLGWIATAAVTGLILAGTALLYPAWAEARHATVTAARAVVGRSDASTARPLWQRIYLDLILLTIAAVVFWRSASTGYQIVLAPEGVPQSSVSYETFLAPLCLWLGAALLALRLWRDSLLRGHGALAKLLQPLAHGLAGIVAASLGRQRTLITRGVVLVALAFSFAISTAIFNTTYNAQARVDAELTNGADVTVSGPTASAPGAKLAQLGALPGLPRRSRCSIVSPTSATTCRISSASTPRISARRPTCPTPSSPTERANDPGDAGGHAGRRAGRRGDGQGFSAQAWRYGQLAPTERARPPVSRRAVPFHRGRPRVSHGAEGLVPGRQRRLYRAADRHGRGGGCAAAGDG